MTELSFIDPPNCTYQTYKIRKEMMKIKVSEVHDVKECTDYRMWHFAMTYYGYSYYHTRRKEKFACHACGKKCKRGNFADVELMSDVWVCDRCLISINAVSLYKKKKPYLFYFNVPETSYRFAPWLNAPTITAIESVGHFHIRLHKVVFKTTREFLRDPPKAIIGNHMYCNYCGRSERCWKSVCFMCCLKRRWLLSRVCIFNHNNCGFPLEITNYILKLLVEHHNLFVSKNS